jgi:peptidoglycan/xylan/chitin deacetylase (PgdA/CDA1 family)
MIPQGVVQHLVAEWEKECEGVGEVDSPTIPVLTPGRPGHQSESPGEMTLVRLNSHLLSWLAIYYLSIAILLGVIGCRHGTLPQPAPTLVTDSQEWEIQPSPRVAPGATRPVEATATSSVTAPTPAATLEVVTHVVQEGDTLFGIALEYGTTAEAIATANDLTSEIIYIGQELTIPLVGPMAPSTVSGAAPRLPPVEPVFITQGDRSLPYIALTFDACQAPGKAAGYDEAIINTLSETGTSATLFLGGLWMQSHLIETQLLAANPLFELGNHSWSHPDFAEISTEEMSAEILRTQDKMYELTGRQPTLFRLPFGTYTDEALAIIAQHGLRTIQWDVVTGDPDPNISAEDILNTISTQVQNGSIVITHMNAWGWHTAEALPAVIEQLSAQGYTFVTVSQLLGLAPPPSPATPEAAQDVP